jgi:hypothetical protein
MRTDACIMLTATAVAVALIGLTGHAQERALEESVLQSFRQSVNDYAALHRRLEKGVTPLAMSSDVQEIRQATDALAEAIQSARATAREGDIFSADVGEVLRVRLARTLADRGFHARDVVAASNVEAPRDAELPAVNGRFPWSRGAAMWPCILNALPPLPIELQYRIVDHDLVLVDIDANLVVDILRGALQVKSKT